MPYEANPGSFRSETGKWYFSCDTGDSVLVGIMEPEEWTCPVLGIEKHSVPWSILQQLYDGSEKVMKGSWGEYSAFAVATEKWNELMNQEVEVEFHPKVLLVETDDGSEDENGEAVFTMLRLHLEFE